MQFLHIRVGSVEMLHGNGI
jgi:hypothetical protein